MLRENDVLKSFITGTGGKIRTTGSSQPNTRNLSSALWQALLAFTGHPGISNAIHLEAAA
jgi:hypothetical protein